MEQWADLNKVLTFLVGGGAPIVVMYALSLVAEMWKGWHTLPKPVKILTPLLLSVLVSIGANVLIGYTEIVNQIAPWYQIVAISVASWLSSQKGYMSARISNYGANKPSG